MDSASTILVNKKYYLINSDSRTVDGLWVGVPPYIKLPLDIKQDVLIESILNALNSSKMNIPHPKDWKLVNQEFLEAINEKSLAGVYKDSKNILISINKGEFTFLPTKNVGGKGRFDHLPELEVKISILSNSHEIYNALKKAISNCS